MSQLSALPESAVLPLEKVAKLQEQLEAARHAAVSSLLDARKSREAELAAIDARLGALGHRLGERGRKPPATSRVCKNCGEAGHNSRSCQSKPAAAKN